MSRLSRIGETAQRHQGKEGKSDLRASGGVCCGVGDEDSQVHGTPDDAKSQALERVMATIEVAGEPSIHHSIHYVRLQTHCAWCRPLGIRTGASGPLPTRPCIPS